MGHYDHVKSALEGAWDHYRPPVGTAEIAREIIIRPGRVYPSRWGGGNKLK